MTLAQILKMMYDIVILKKLRYESVVTLIVEVVLCNLPKKVIDINHCIQFMLLFSYKIIM